MHPKMLIALKINYFCLPRTLYKDIKNVFISDLDKLIKQ